MMAGQLVQPDRAFVPERDGKRLHSVRASRHGRVAMCLRQPRQLVPHGRDIAQDDGVHRFELQGYAGVDHILRRGAVVHPFAVVSAATRLQLLQRRDQ
ncbi:hypothetical protein G6F63_016649 [Rhizopus arrhizus]|nr:hypothetical protein G6F32_017238 [Rhizopus arrhizus]KAG1304090.1 hypothetical protein G6F63_016649 [Rhizopus arrhizus]